MNPHQASDGPADCQAYGQRHGINITVILRSGLRRTRLLCRKGCKDHLDEK